MLKNVYLFQAEITATPGQHHLPYSVGCIWAYANQFEDIQSNFALKRVFWKRDRQQDIIDSLVDPHIVGFSTYVWNHQWNITLARKIKQKYPTCIVIFGGPSVNEHWVEHDFINVAMFGEGEQGFAELLKKIIANEPLPKVWNSPRQESLLGFPSPYTTGFFDDIIKENPDVGWYMMMESNRGCPYHCTFCGWGAEYLNKMKLFSLERVAADIAWGITNNVHWIFFLDANTGILKERDVEIAHMVRRAIEDPRSKIRRVTFNHAKNLNEHCIEIEKIVRDWSYGLEVSVQSLHVPTLDAVKRFNIGVEKLQRTYKLSQQHGIRYYTELVLGLPLETKDTYIDGVFKLLEMGQHDSIKTYPATVIPNSEMDEPAYQKKYGIKLMYPRDLFRSPEERQWDDEDGSHETIAMVSATGSATSIDLADCLAHSWMMSQFHYSGISQVVSKYLYYMHNIPYRAFYQRLYGAIKADALGGPILSDVETILRSYMEHGTIPSVHKWSNVVALTLPESFEFTKIIANKAHFIELAVTVCKSFVTPHPDIPAMQRSFVRLDDTTYPFEIRSGIDIDRWTETPCTYKVYKRSSVTHMRDQMYLKWLEKNDVINITNPYTVAAVEESHHNKSRSVIPIAFVSNAAKHTEGIR
jgi:radical SAM superfamily enzyme YgiQ (UPF0313 family)